MKSGMTTRIERALFFSTRKMGTFCCFEVTIGWFGSERVDMMAYDTTKTWRCWEIKVSASDFRSQSAHTFVGHLNYYAMPPDLYPKVKDEVPDGIGVWVLGEGYVRKAKRRTLKVDERVLFESMVRSLAREHYKMMSEQRASLHMRNDYRKDMREKLWPCPQGQFYQHDQIGIDEVEIYGGVKALPEGGDT